MLWAPSSKRDRRFELTGKVPSFRATSQMTFFGFSFIPAFQRSTWENACLPLMCDMGHCLPFHSLCCFILPWKSIIPGYLKEDPCNCSFCHPTHPQPELLLTLEQTSPQTPQLSPLLSPKAWYHPKPRGVSCESRAVHTVREEEPRAGRDKDAPDSPHPLCPTKPASNRAAQQTWAVHRGFPLLEIHILVRQEA